MDQSVEHTDGPSLTPQDAAALDALVSGNARASGVPLERVARVEGLLSLLGTPTAGESGDGSLVDLTYLRVLRAAEAPVLDDDALAPTCADALDSWVHSGYDASRTPAVFREHAVQHQRLAALVTAPVPGERSGRERLVGATLDRVQRRIDESEANLSTARWRPSRGLRLTDVVSIAAMLLLSTAIILPVASSVREGQRRTVCNSNLAGVGGALGMYAMSNASSLPMVSAGADPRWMDVGQKPESSNSANLYLLVRTNHVSLEQLACPGNPEAPRARLASDLRDWRGLEEISYSYRISPLNQRLRWGETGSRRLVMADRSPVVLKVALGEPIVPEANSPNHALEGEHLLFSDRSVDWVTSPVVDGDNIWLPRAIERQIETARRSRGLIRGDERPTSPDDVFLAP